MLHSPQHENGLRVLSQKEFTNLWPEKKKYEFRKFVRFTIHDCVLVDFKSTECTEFNLGEVLDISLGGLGLQCIDYGSAVPESGKLRFFLSVPGIKLSGIPFEKVWDLRCVHHMPLATISTIRCGITFGHMTEMHQTALRHFIENYTTADPEG